MTAAGGAAPELRALAQRAWAADGLSQSRAAREIGLSEAALSQWLAGKYKGAVAEVERKVRRWLEARDARARLAAALPDPPAWIETPTAKRVLAGLGYAQLAGDVAVVYGGAGLGKTVAARRYAAQKPNVWLATMSPATHTLAACLERTAGACGLRAAHGRAARLEADLAARLAGARGLLAIDEAQHLGVRALEGLRALHDATGTGLALVGNDLLYSRLTGGRRAAEFAQLFSRVGKRVHLSRPTEEDVAAVLAAWGVAGSLDRGEAVRIARRPGGLRGLGKALRLAAVFAQGAPVGGEHLRAAWRDLGGE